MQVFQGLQFCKNIAKYPVFFDVPIRSGIKGQGVGVAVTVQAGIPELGAGFVQSSIGTVSWKNWRCNQGITNAAQFIAGATAVTRAADQLAVRDRKREVVAHFQPGIADFAVHPDRVFLEPLSGINALLIEVFAHQVIGAVGPSARCAQVIPAHRGSAEDLIQPVVVGQGIQYFRVVARQLAPRIAQGVGILNGFVSDQQVF